MLIYEIKNNLLIKVADYLWNNILENKKLFILSK